MGARESDLVVFQCNDPLVILGRTLTIGQGIYRVPYFDDISSMVSFRYASRGGLY